MKKCWSIVEKPNRVKNIPPYCEIVECVDEISGEKYWQIMPNANELIEDSYYGYVKYYDSCEDNYRGYVINITDHGNISLLFRFKNGNTREVWSMV